MKKGLYISINLKRMSAVVFSAVLIASCLVSVRYSTMSVATANMSEKSKTVIVDAGHGGADGGTQSASGILEKDINLAIAEKVGNILCVLGYNVIYTRETDDIPYSAECKTIRQKKVWDTHRRMDIIESNPDGIFLSIHQNYFGESKYKGTQVFYSANNPESQSIAECIQNTVALEIQPDNSRQIKKCTTDVYILYHSKIPSVMVECGFLSNPEEASLLTDEVYQQKLALAIVKGLTEYKKVKTDI